MTDPSRNRTPRIALPLAGAFLLTVLLAACSTGGGQVTGPSFEVQVADPDGAGPAALAQLMVGEAAFGTTSLGATSAGELSPSDLIEVDTDVWLGNTVDAGAGDTVEIVLPTEDELPAGTSADVANAFPDVTETTDCDVDASASAMVSVTVFDLVTVPGLVAYTFGSGSGGTLAYAALSDAALDTGSPIPDGTRLYTWIHSDGVVDVAFTGTGCDTAGLAADLSLEAGWNFAAWVVDDATSTVTLTDVEQPDSLVATVVTSL